MRHKRSGDPSTDPSPPTPPQAEPARPLRTRRGLQADTCARADGRVILCTVLSDPAGSRVCTFAVTDEPPSADVLVSSIRRALVREGCGDAGALPQRAAVPTCPDGGERVAPTPVAFASRDHASVRAAALLAADGVEVALPDPRRPVWKGEVERRLRAVVGDVRPGPEPSRAPRALRRRRA